MKTESNKMVIQETLSIKNAFNRLNESGEKKILLVVAEKDGLIGVVTDSDLRNAVVRGDSLDNPVSSIMKRDYKFVLESDEDGKEKARNLMLEFGIEQIPVLNENKLPVGFILWKDFFEKKAVQLHSNKVIIMAGGKGTRLAPFTKILPKPLIPIGESPIIDVIIQKFVAQGFRDIVISVNYKKEMIKNYFLENKHDAKISFLEEDSFLGTAGALKTLAGKTQEPFFVTNCDIILETDYQDALQWHQKNKKAMTLIGSYKEINIPYGVIEHTNGCLMTIEEKPQYNVLINCGFYIIEPSVLDLIPEGEFNMDQLIQKLQKAGQEVGVYPICSGWFDTGQWEEYRITLKHFEELIS